MSPANLRKAERKRLVRRIAAHIEDFPWQYTALESAMSPFGEKFDLVQLKDAFNTKEDVEAYNRAQALERAVGRVQGYVGDMALDGVRLVGLPRKPAGGEGFRAKHAFEALRSAEVIDGHLCRRLIRAQNMRSEIEHEYLRLPVGKVHEATVLVHESSAEFFGLYCGWIALCLD